MHSHNLPAKEHPDRIKQIQEYSWAFKAVVGSDPLKPTPVEDIHSWLRASANMFGYSVLWLHYPTSAVVPSAAKIVAEMSIPGCNYTAVRIIAIDSVDLRHHVVHAPPGCDNTNGTLLRLIFFVLLPNLRQSIEDFMRERAS